jgi:hypothetical protein
VYSPYESNHPPLIWNQSPLSDKTLDWFAFRSRARPSLVQVRATEGLTQTEGGEHDHQKGLGRIGLQKVVRDTPIDDPRQKTDE